MTSRMDVGDATIVLFVVGVKVALFTVSETDNVCFQSDDYLCDAFI